MAISAETQRSWAAALGHALSGLTVYSHPTQGVALGEHVAPF
jgi:hypothetical protein